MFFEDKGQIKEIASRTGTAIFVLPEGEEVKIKNALVIQPEKKTVITIEQVRETISSLGLRQITDRFILVRPADKLSEAAANAFLKNLEEPQEKVHFVLITAHPSKLLPTILSRANLYFLKQPADSITEIQAEEKEKQLAKRLIAGKPQDIIVLADEIAKQKKSPREYALRILGVAIEMLYKSYFLTKKELFLRKLPRFLRAYENIAKNGHIKLQIVANLG